VEQLWFLDIDLPLAGFSPWSATLDPEGNGLAGPGVPGGVLFQPQFSFLPAWTNWGSSNYHSLLLSVRKMVGNIVFNFNYVLSKSIDNGSTPENADAFRPWPDGVTGSAGVIPNALRPKAHRAVSDFDLRHNLNANWVVQLPFGHRAGAWKHLIEGWQISGVWRWRSGFPLSPRNGGFYPTNWFLQGNGTLTAPTPTNITRSDRNGNPNLFEDPEAVRPNITFTGPGGVGSRNVIRGDDFFNLDLGLGKTVRIGDRYAIQFRWEVFNVFNNVNFAGGSLNPLSVNNFGRLWETAGGFPTEGARDMQFLLRIEF
jgi:hypothetical protein